MARRVLIVLAAIGLVAASCSDDGSGTTQTLAGSAPTTIVAATTSTTAAATATPTTSTTSTTTSTTLAAVETEISAFIAAYGEPGDCIDVTYDGDDYDYAAGVEHVPCDGPHDHEVFYVGELAAPVGEPWPGEDAVIEAVFGDICIDEFSEIYGSWDDTFTLALWATYPLEEEWSGGLRTFKCSATSWFNSDDGTPLVGPAASAGLSLPGETVAVVTEFDGRDFYLYTFDEDGGVQEARNLTDDGDAGNEDVGIPSWSPDGSVIAFSSLDPEVADEQWDIWLIDTTSGEKTQLSSDTPNDSSPVFSPDGTKLLFTSRDRAQPERDIWVMDADGTNMVRLTDDPAAESSAHWSPDGSQIVFRSKANGTNDIWIMNADGTQAELLIDAGGDEFDPRWSPGGDQIAFISDVTGAFDIWVVGVDGQGAVNLTNHPASDEYPSWSPGGEFILFNSDRRGVTSLWVMRSDGSDQSDLILDFPTGWGAVGP